MSRSLKVPVRSPPSLTSKSSSRPSGEHAQGFYRRVFSCAVLGGVHEQLVFSIGSFPHINARLFLLRQALPEEIAVADLLE